MRESRSDGVRLLVGAGLGLLLSLAAEGVPLDMGLCLGAAIGLATGAGAECRRRRAASPRRATEDGSSG